MNKVFVFVLLSISLSINGYATVSTRSTNAESFDIRLSDGTTICARSAKTVGKKVFFIPCVAQKKRFKTLPISEIVAVTDAKGNAVQLPQTLPTDERNEGEKMARTSLLAGILALIGGLLGLLIGAAGLLQNASVVVGGTPNQGNSNLSAASILLIGSGIGALFGLIYGTNSRSWFENAGTTSNVYYSKAQTGMVLSGLVLLLLLVVVVL